jgi:hypothetical protein
MANQTVVVQGQQMVQVAPAQQMVVMQPVGQLKYPNESTWVGKYGGGTFACLDDIETCLISWWCTPCANGQSDAWGSVISGDGPVGQKVCMRCCLFLCCPECYCCAAASTHMAVERRIANFHGATPANDWTGRCVCHYICAACEQAKLSRAIKNFKALNGNGMRGMGVPAEIEMKR